MSNEKEIGKIYETKEYERFKLINGNRRIDQKHVETLKEKMKVSYLVDPIMVNSRLGIMDGQHRYFAAKSLGLPIRWYIAANMTPQEIAKMNGVAKKWRPENYADVYDTEGYKLYKTFRAQYPQFDHTVVLTLLSNRITSVGGGSSDFRDGNFEVKSWNKAISLAKLLTEIGEFTPVYNKRSFVYAIIHILDNKDFTIKRLMRKMPKKALILKDFAKTEDFIKVLEEMYNWMESDKVRLY